jgi:hypothetical protein
MPLLEPKMTVILRRMKRKGVSSLPWAPFNPKKASPDELTFELLDAGQRTTGKIVVTKFSVRPTSIGLTANTPWGQADLRYTKEGPRIYINEREIALFRSYMLKGRAEFVFPDGTIMKFDKVKGRRNDIVYSGQDGRVGIFEERGTLPDGARARPISLSKDEIKMMPKEDRPRSVETDDYVMFRIEVEGKTPVNQEDIIIALSVVACFGRLIEEIP